MYQHRGLLTFGQKTFSFTNKAIRSHYPKRASVLEFKDPATPRFGHSGVVFDLFTETCLLHLISLLSNLSNLSYLFRHQWAKIIWLYVLSTTNSVHKAFLLMIDRRYLLVFVTKHRQKTTSLRMGRVRLLLATSWFENQVSSL